MMLLGLASHRCPSAHSHKSGVLLLTYVVDRHLPPWSLAISRINGNPSFSGAGTWRGEHTGHQFTACITLAGVACQRWPSPHSHTRYLFAPLYSVERHFPPCFFATSRMRSIPSGKL